MAQPTYTAEVVVLRKTKLGESDLILTCLSSDGSQLRLVAKGARKPTSSFSSRLEIFSNTHLLIVHGRSLDIIKEAKLLHGFDRLRTDPERTGAASALCEFLGKVTEPGLEVNRLYDMTLAALEAFSTAPLDAMESLAVASILKGFAFCGIMPELSNCVGCGASIDLKSRQQRQTWFSYTEGGLVCEACRSGMDCVAIDTATLAWMKAFLFCTFAEVSKMEPENASFSCLQICQHWCRVHIGAPLKSIEFLLTNPLNF